MYVMGIDPTKVSTSVLGADFILGTLGANAGSPTLYTAPMGTTGSTAGANLGPKAYVYCKSAAGTTAGNVVLIDQNNDAVNASATTGASGTGMGKQIGVAVGTIAAGGFGWVQVYGKCTFLVVAATATNSPVSLGATAGAFDDLTTTGSITVTGVNISAVNSTTGTGFLNWPHLVVDDVT
jgi:hypothetical protein